MKRHIEALLRANSRLLIIIIIIIITTTIIIIFFSLGCSSCVPSESEEVASTPARDWRCSPLPDTFDQTDLVGTWTSKRGNLSTDTIVIHEDGTFRQTFHRRANNYFYESPWNRWWLERKTSGGVYLHLEGMHYCISTDEMCEREGGGGGNWTFYDKCEGRSVSMVNEVILVVTGTEGVRYPGIELAPRGIMLRYLRSDPDTTDHFFFLEEPAE